MQEPKIPEDLSKISDHRKKEYYKKQAIWFKKCNFASREAWARHEDGKDNYNEAWEDAKLQSMYRMLARHKLGLIWESMSVTSRPSRAEHEKNMDSRG